ncbi:outer membrane protein assembly factor BamB family protein [Nonomuraea ceibae]|uniref:outer membrane protein assembly factor BamB family protein n=1 Tax=Nonomuraea ceibae TaxID=1935170 RepID=UPI001C604B10|nr:PQQ-binding-like beta-propeller repeat protein [Nonomuraea ceibae]
MISIRITGAVAVLCLALSSGCGVLPGSPKESGPAEGPRRVTVEAPAGADDGGGGASHHWVGLNPVWKVEQIDETPQHHGLVSDGTRVVALRKEIKGGAAGELTGYDGASGKRLWRRELGWSGASAPVAEDGTVVVPLGAEVDNRVERPGQFVALDTATGEERWRVRVRQRAFMTSHLYLPAPAQGAILDGVFYYADGPHLYGRDLVSGKVVHRRTSRSHLAVAGPVRARQGLVVLVRPDPFKHVEGVDGTVRSLAVLSPELTPVHQADLPKGTEATEVITGGAIAVVSEGGGTNPHMWGFDTRTGKRLWSRPLGKSQYVGPPVRGVVPVLDGSRNHEQRFVGHDLRTGERLWTLEPRKAEVRIDRARTMGVADGTLFGLGHGVEIVDPATGKVTFAHQFTPRGGGRVVAAAGRIVIYNHDGLMGFD